MTLTLKELADIDRPHPNLQKLYIYGAVIGTMSSCFLGLPVALMALIPLLIRYHTLRYRFEEEGVGVSWGFFFRHETYLTYEKVQDIHLNRGILERWLGLGTVAVQTASGTAAAEISFVGLDRFDEVRDFLYSRMRRFDDGEGAPDAEGAVALLKGIREELGELKTRLSGGEG